MSKQANIYKVSYFEFSGGNLYKHSRNMYVLFFQRLNYSIQHSLNIQIHAYKHRAVTKLSYLFGIFGEL